MKSKLKLEYLWLDGYETPNLRSKIKVIDTDNTPSLSCAPMWSFDGSSTKQATGNNSDCLLNPVKMIKSPLDDSYIVLCEVLNSDGSLHISNKRHELKLLDEKYKHEEMWFGFEQEYVIYEARSNRPYKWPIDGYPAEQGRFYCGVGGDVAWGRNISNEHLDACLQCGLSICGTNGEVMPSQWEFQLGILSPLEMADQLWLARFLLNRIAERYDANIKLDPKPVHGDWNGSGCHVNFSTKSMRQKCTESDVNIICSKLARNRKKHIDVYGKGNEKRLTGKHETCRIDEFRWGVSDRGASIRIPISTAKDDKGYLEDRAIAANCDPYLVCSVMLETICGEQ